MSSSSPSGNSSPSVKPLIASSLLLTCSNSVQGSSKVESSLVNMVVTAMDNRRRYFTHDKTEREAHLRDLATDSTTRSALDVVLNSPPWKTQTGELDRFQLQALLEVRREAVGETYRCRFHQCDYRNGESTNAVEHVRGAHFGNRPFLCGGWWAVVLKFLCPWLITCP
jgi:hypothetical protein